MKFKQTITQQSEILLFGKYKHCTIQHVLRIEPSYILWLASEKIVQFPQDILDQADDNIQDEGYDDFKNDYLDIYE